MKEYLPNSRECYVCGVENNHGLKMRFYKTGPKSIACDHLIQEKFQGYHGVVHGGIVSSMLDEMCVRAFMAEDPNRLMYTARLTVRFRKPVPVGEKLHLEGDVIKSKTRSGEAHARVYGPDGSLYAEAEALAVDFQTDLLEGEDIEELGWKVYGDEFFLDKEVEA